MSLLHRLLDTLSPRGCVVCGQRLAPSEQVVCTRCNLLLPRTGFELSASDNEMARRFWGIIPLERAAALFYYEAGSESDQIIRRMKYHDHPEIGEQMGRLMARDFMSTGFFRDIEAIVPVPLTARRQRQRGYNQSLEIARGLREITHIPIINNAIRRLHFRQSQTQQHFMGRKDNVEGAFKLVSKRAIAHRHLLIVDDVVTTGATVTACAKELLKAEGVTLSVLSIAATKL